MIKPVIFDTPVKDGAAVQICPHFPERVAELEKDLNLGYKFRNGQDVDPGVIVQVRRILRDFGIPGRSRHAVKELSGWASRLFRRFRRGFSTYINNAEKYLAQVSCNN